LEIQRVKKLSSAADPLWYKDAVIYELHVRAFSDSNNDGIGDFPGLMSRLDYLQELGVTCLWLLPFFPSPLRDDGYDIANYVAVNPSYGTLDDFKQFLDAAHKRNMQVMIELVINHTSDQHPWFQAARHAPPGSPEREMYVWSDTDQIYKDARIIFTDTEKSNWTWDDTAKSFYWHRFFSHQPDLNFDNPRVIEEVIQAMRFWLDMGVDALRMDAIPYLIERDGTNCENLPETHVAIKKIRAAIDEDYANRLILAEANQWPADVRPYFGDGDECHMAFHFPLMPRIYMALRQEDRLPITDIMAQTPDIPEACQWGLFLRNHDELTLEMVSDEERDYMYFAYSADPRMRINVGIRRRLAPLLDNNRRRIELLNSLLLSFPGTPILYYGDEIGMGDNIYLGDRNGVRTPMQWNSDRNAGFSKCDPAKLYFPVVMDPIYGYQVLNVEGQLTDQSSLLHWMRNMIALRKLFQVFGRGTLRFLHPENRKILAYLRDLKREDGSHETVLCVANLSRFAQPVALDLIDYEGAMPVEMLGYVPFPQITDAPYVLTVAPYSFLWFELQPEAPRQDQPEQRDPIEDLVTNSLVTVAHELVTQGWSALLKGEGLHLLERTLPAWLLRQRWFGAKTRTIEQIRVQHWVPLDTLVSRTSQNTALETSASNNGPSATTPQALSCALFFVEVFYRDAQPDLYQLPLALTTGSELEALLVNSPNAILAQTDTSSGPIALHDATVREDARHSLLSIIDAASHLEGSGCTLVGEHSQAYAQLGGNQVHPGRLGSAEQSNTNILYGRDMILKLFRRLQPGENPDVEIGRFLTEVAHFDRIPPFLGEITLSAQLPNEIQTHTTSAMLQGLVANQGDGWSWTLEELGRFYEAVAGLPEPETIPGSASFFGDNTVPQSLHDLADFSLNSATLLGRRSAEMHLALSTETQDEAFRAEPFTLHDLALDARRIDAQIHSTLDALKSGISRLSDLTADAAATLLSRRIGLFESAQAISANAVSGQRIRIHGDYHLGQVLRSRNDFILLDFEGEPARTLEERRRKQSPLRDVAGMLRSYSYAAATAFTAFIQRHPDRAGSLTPWRQAWEAGMHRLFLAAYRDTITARPGLLPTPSEADKLLQAYLLEKALYELLYELNNRPDWVHIPLAGLLALSEPSGGPTPNFQQRQEQTEWQR